MVWVKQEWRREVISGSFDTIVSFLLDLIVNNTYSQPPPPILEK
jgi:hypothetical protein